MADAAEAVGAGRLQGLQHGGHAVAQVQVGVAHNGGGRAAGAVEPAGAGRGQALDEFHFAHGAHLLRTVGAVHRARLDEHGGAYVVAALHVGGQLVEQVALVGDARGAKVPEMVMGIADGQLRFQRLFLGQRQPVIASEWHDGTSVRGLRADDVSSSADVRHHSMI